MRARNKTGLGDQQRAETSQAMATRAKMERSPAQRPAKIVLMQMGEEQGGASASRSDSRLSRHFAI